MVSLLPVPALLIKMSAPSKASAVRFSTASTPLGCATSAATPTALTPYCFAIALAASATRASLRAHSTSCTPSAARPSATASPMPTLPPVTTATLPFRPRSIGFSARQALLALRSAIPLVYPERRPPPSPDVTARGGHVQGAVLRAAWHAG